MTDPIPTIIAIAINIYFVIDILFFFEIFGESGFGESGFGESGFGESGFGESGFGESGFGESGFGESLLSVE